MEYGTTIVLKMYNSKLTRKGGQANKELTRTRNRNPANQKVAGTEKTVRVNWLELSPG